MATRTPRLFSSRRTLVTHSTSLMASVSVISRQIWLGSTPVASRIPAISSPRRGGADRGGGGKRAGGGVDASGGGDAELVPPRTGPPARLLHHEVPDGQDELGLL